MHILSPDRRPAPRTNTTSGRSSTSGSTNIKEYTVDWAELWNGLFWPLLRLFFLISLGLLIGNLIEALNWTRAMARIAAPLVRMGRLKDIAGASFSLAFFSGVAANTMLAEAHEQGKLSDKELILSNMFNSMPTFFLHLPTMFFITLPFIKGAAVIYVGLTLFSAILRTACIVGLGRLLLPPLPEGCITCVLEEQKSKSWRDILGNIWKRFLKRIKRIAVFTAPIFALFYVLRVSGVFEVLEKGMAEHIGFLGFLSPEAIGIVVFHVAAEFTAGLAAAGALLQTGNLGVREVVLALLVGNVLSTPMRAFRHQFPYYAGIFKPRMAMKLIVYNQILRAGSIIAVGVAFYYLGQPLVDLFT